MPPNDPTRSGAEVVHAALADAGVELVVGIPGRGSLPLDERIAADASMDYVMARHESAVPYIAWGYHEAGGGLPATMTVPGPGDTNASNGLRNAVVDRVPLVHVSTDTHPDHRGKGAIHEIDPATYDHVVKANYDVANPLDLPRAVEAALETAQTPPFGPVRLGVPHLRTEIEAGPVDVTPERATWDNEAAYADAIERLASAERPVVYVGVEARRSPGGPDAVRSLVEALDAPVVSSFKGKGVFDETDPHWAGTTGPQTPPGTVAMLDAADVVLAVGTTFGGPTTRYWSLPMGEALLQVAVHPDDVGPAYDPAVAVLDDPAAACERLEAGLVERGGGSGWAGAELAGRARGEYLDYLDDCGVFEDRSPAPTPAVVRSLREALPEEAIVVADIGEFRVWAMQLFEAPAPESFVATGFWTSMGVGLPGALGAKLANPDRPVVCLTGDGGFMMADQELHTAAEHGVDVTTVVFNNADYAMISNAPELEGGRRFGWRSPDFTKVAEGFGCGASRADSPGGAVEAVEAALAADGPQLVDVTVDPDEPSAMEGWGFETAVELPAD